MVNKINLVIVITTLLFAVSCTGHKEEANDDSKEVVADTSICRCDIPEEVRELVKPNMIYAQIEVSVDIDHMGNSVYSLDTTLKFEWIANSEYPKGGKLFSNSLKVYSAKVDNVKYRIFYNYLQSINNDTLIQVYKTPNNLMVNGGANTYIYINTENGDKWLCFEPEASGILEEISREFNSVFIE